MSSYTAIIRCKKCGKELATINAYHEPRPDIFVPQDIAQQEFALSAMFCQDCLNGKNDAVTDPETVTDKCPFEHKPDCTYYPDGCGKCMYINP